MKTINRFAFVLMTIFAIMSCKEDEIEPTLTAQTVTIAPAGNHTLEPGDELQLSATVLPENAIDRNVVWSSDNRDVAMVEASGLVKAISEGQATITASVGEIKSSSSITVAKGVVAVGSVAIAPVESLTITEGGTLQLSATVSPDDATDRTVTWTSSSDGVASVDGNGLVTAVAAGNATITATAGGVSDSVDITVEAAYVPVTDIVHNVSNNILALLVGETFLIQAGVMPINANAKTIDFSVDIRSRKIKVSDSGLVRASAIGVEKITLTVIGNGDAENPEYSEEIYVQVVEMPTGWSTTETGAKFTDSSNRELVITLADGVCTAAQYTCLAYEAKTSINELFPDAVLDAFTITGRGTIATIDLLKIKGCKEYFEGLTLAGILARFGDDTSAILASWQDGLRATAFVTEGWSMPDISTIRYEKEYDGDWTLDLKLNKLTGLVDSGKITACCIDINVCDAQLYYYIEDLLDASYSFTADLVGYNQFLVQHYSEIEPLTYFDGYTLTSLIQKDVWSEFTQKSFR